MLEAYDPYFDFGFKFSEHLKNGCEVFIPSYQQKLRIPLQQHLLNDLHCNRDINLGLDTGPIKMAMTVRTCEYLTLLQRSNIELDLISLAIDHELVTFVRS